MSTPIEELIALVDALRAETTEQSITPERMGAILQRMIDVLPSVSDANSLKGWVAISSINELPSNPSPTQRALAYLLDTTLYVYVGSGGDTFEGKYRSAELKGTKGDTGNPGADGKDGKDGVDLGLANIVDDLETGTSTDVLSGGMGKALAGLINFPKKIKTFSWTRGSGIDSLCDSATFGQAKSTSNTYAYCDYVECIGYKRISGRMIAVQTGTTNAFCGLVFYDTDKNPMVGYNFTASSSTYFEKTLDIPNGAAYFRQTTYYADINTYPPITLYKESIQDIENKAFEDENFIPHDFYWLNTKAIDANPSSETYGKTKTASASYYCHPFISCVGFDLLKVGIVVTTIGSPYSFAGLVFYNSNKEPIHSINLHDIDFGQKTLSLSIPECAFYFRNTWWNSTYPCTLIKRGEPMKELQSDVDDLLSSVNKNLELPPSNKTTSTYIGEKILIESLHPLGIEQWFSATKSGSTARQGAACYGEILFTFHHSNDIVEVYNMRTQQRTQIINPVGGSSTLHCATANFSMQFYDSSDPFPLLYLSNGGIEVWRITGTEGDYSMTLVQTINGSGSDIYLAEDGTFWQIGWGGGATWDANPTGLGYMRFRQYPIPAISQSVATFDPDTYIKEICTTWRYSLQGSFIKGNKLYFLWGGAGNSGIDVIDMGSGRMLSMIDLSGNGMSYEPEGLFVYNNELYLTVYPGSQMFKIYT